MRREELEYEEPSQILRKLADHEIYFTFNSDEAGIAFYEWWHSEGEEAFVKWAEGWKT